jgi:hypothetical protein
LIARQDADDLSHPERFARQVAEFQADPNLVLVGTSGDEVNVRGSRLATLRMPVENEAIRWALLLDNAFLHTSVMFRKEPVLKEFGGYDEAFRVSQDYALWSALVRAGYRVRNLAARLVKVRVHSESLSRGDSGQTDRETMSVLRENVTTLCPAMELSESEFEMLARYRWKLQVDEAEKFRDLLGHLFALHREKFQPGRSAERMQARHLFRAGYNLLEVNTATGVRLIAAAAAYAPEEIPSWPWARVAALGLFGGVIRKLARR